MIGGKTVLAVIPARGGSKGIPRKNLRELGGRPLIAWTIGEAKKSRYVDRLILSSEDEEIIRVAREWSCEVPFVRPAELSRDETPGVDPVLHAMEMLPGYDYVVLLQPTSPLRKAEDIDGAIRRCAESGAPSCVTVTESPKHPRWMFTLDPAGRLHPVVSSEPGPDRRQDLPKVYELNGAVYVADAGWLGKSRRLVAGDTVGHVMPGERSVDIDDEAHLRYCEYLLSRELSA